MFDFLRELALPEGYAIFGSGPLAVRGIIPTCNDLDVLCNQDVWDIVAPWGELVRLDEYDVTVVCFLDGAVTFGTEWGIGDFDVAELIASAETIDGLPFVRLEHVIRYKTLRANSKDRQHLEALRSAGHLLDFH